MTETQKQNLLNLLKPNEVLTNLIHTHIESDERGFPQFKTVYENPPTNYKLIRIIAPYNVAILEDLSYINGTV